MNSGEVHKATPNKKEDEKRSSQRRCYRCDGRHDPSTCKFKTGECRFCSKVHGINQVQHSTDEIKEVILRHHDVFREDIDGYTGPSGIRKRRQPQIFQGSSCASCPAGTHGR
ncbi:hypothetical protein MRX96_014871 [Rhipicephalus microplus]